MAHETPTEIRKRILFISFMLGVMVGIGAYLAVKAVQQQNVALIAVVLPLFLTAIPLVRTLRRLRKDRQSTE